MEEKIKHPRLGVRSFQFEPSWVEIAPEKIVFGYVGIYVNTDFDMTFVKINEEWTLRK